MRHLSTRLMVAVAGLCTTAAMPPAVPASAVTGSARPAAVTGAGSRTALLPTGDQVTVTDGPGGRRTAAIEPAAERGLGRVLLNLKLGGRSYEVPAAALPYLGRGLDVSLFDVDALLARENEARVPVEVRHSGTPPALPGLTVTGTRSTAAAGTTTTGYLTGSSAREFGAALVRQFLDDRAHHAFGTRGLFAGGTAIRLAGTTDTPAAQPRFPMQTLTVNATDAAGRPDQGDPVFLYNVDDSGRFGRPDESLSYFTDGTAKYSLPSGHYSAVALFFTTDDTGDLTGVRLVSRPELTVSGDQTVRLDACEADSRVTMVTPRPALPAEGGFVLRRTAQAGPSFYLDSSTGPGVPIWVAPTHQPVTVGGLQTYPYQRLTSPPGPGTPYEYNLQHATTGVIPAQRYVIRAAELATVDATYYSELNSVGLRQRAAIYPFEFTEGVGRGTHPLNLPRHQTEYVTGDPSLLWFGGMAKYTRDSGGFSAWYGGQYETGHAYRAGQQVREDWNRFPLHPAGNVSLLDAPPPAWLTRPPATRAGDTVALDLTPFSDSQAGHTGFGWIGESRDTIGGGWEIYRDGVRLAGGDASRLGLQAAVPVGPDPSTLRLVVDATRTGPMYLLSTGTHTEWTWRSAHVPDTTLPDAYSCGRTSDRNCAVEPLLTVGYAIGGLAMDGSVRMGPQTLDLTIGHLQLATAAAVTGATVQFSTDEGATWREASVTGAGDGRYRATFTATADPWARDASVTLRITATDAAGGQLAETTSRAYRIIP